MIPLADRRTFAELLALARAQGWRIEMLSKQAVRVTHECHSLSIVVAAAKPYVAGRMELARAIGAVSSMQV